MVGISIVTDKKGVGRRKMRRPQHTFNLRQLPFQIQPFLIAPVLPGETMKSLMMQSRVVTDPIINPLIGWWMEYYFFYVKHRDLAIRASATEMMINPAFDIDAIEPEAASIAHWHSTAGVSWVHECLQRVVEEYFRNEGETFDEFVSTTGSGNLPVASIGKTTALDSIILETEEDDVDIDLTDAGSEGGVAVLASEIENALQQWQFARMNNLTDMTYEDYLKSYGIQGVAAEEPHKPELLRFIREWTYPTNTINPSDGAPTSACSWAFAEKADKDRFFREPGFIFGVCIARPKVYLKRVSGNFSDLMNDAMSWLPAVLENDIRVGRKSIAASAKPLESIAVETVIDIRDLLLYGDEMRNFIFSATGYNEVPLPDDTGGPVNKAYLTGDQSKGFFTQDVAADFLVRSDGVVNLQIASRQQDVTPTTSSRAS